MLSFDENGCYILNHWKNITYDNDLEINGLMIFWICAEEEDSWSNGVREFVKKRMEQGRDNIKLDPLVKVYHKW